MCGIFAVFSKRGKLPEGKCLNALSSLRHRGPDFEFHSFHEQGQLFLGQVVLSITGNPQLDLARYHSCGEGRHSIIFNGEIYNFNYLCQEHLSNNLMHTHTDVEVLLNLCQKYKKERVLSLLEGMFAFVHHDNKRRTLTLARDLIGEKILYLYEDEECLILSSEVRAIRTFKPQIYVNKNHLRNYFYSRHLLALNETPFAGISALPAGSVWEYSLASHCFEQKQTRTLFDLVNLDRMERARSRTLTDLADECDEVFQQSARMLMPQIKYASVFSGGVDSSLASAYMLDTPNPPTLISLDFPGKDKITSSLKPFEAILQSEIIKHEVNEDVFADALRKSYEHCEMPMHTHSFVSQKILADHVNAIGLKVLIGGDGADELFGGYEAYDRMVGNQSAVNKSPYAAFIDLGFEFESYCPKQFEQRLTDHWRSALNCFESLEMEERTIQASLMLDTILQLESVGLRAADLMSMTHSVESRGFFLTTPVLEFVINLPAAMKVPSTFTNKKMATKPILKELFIRRFGKKLLFPKQGFSGYPNEAGRRLVNNDYHFFKKFLQGRMGDKLEFADVASEWKMINVELFLAATIGQPQPQSKPLSLNV